MCEPTQNSSERGEVSGACERASHLGTTVIIQISRLRRAYATRLFPLLPIAFIGATLNRTARSFALAIIGAEYLLGWLPPGTHDWRRLVRPSEFVLGLRRAGLPTVKLAGLSYDWRDGSWRQSEDLSVNYMLLAVRR